MNKALAVLLTTVLVSGMMVFKSSTAEAQEATGMRDRANMVNAFSQKLGIDPDKAEEAMEQVRAEHQAQMQEALTEDLEEAVSSGKLTEAQKQLILEKHEELKSTREQRQLSRAQLTREERLAQREQERSELLDWAEANQIDPEFISFGPKLDGSGMGKGMGIGGRHNCNGL